MRGLFAADTSRPAFRTLGSKEQRIRGFSVFSITFLTQAANFAASPVTDLTATISTVSQLPM